MREAGTLRRALSIDRIIAEAFVFDGSEATELFTCVGSNRFTLLYRFGGARLRRERQARSCVLSLWVTYLPQRVSSVALRALFPFARVSLQRRTLLSLGGGARLRRERQARFDVLPRLVLYFSKAFKIGGSEGTVSSSCVGSHRITLLGRFGGERRRRER